MAAVHDERRRFVDRMFRARLSWTLIGAVGLLGLTADLEVGLRGALLAFGIAAFAWLNDPLLRWVLAARRTADPAWKPMAIGLVLRVLGLIAVIAVSW